jgi:hypothetical protein
MAYLHTKTQLPSSNRSSVVVIKPKLNMTSCSRHAVTLYKQIAL